MRSLHYFINNQMNLLVIPFVSCDVDVSVSQLICLLFGRGRVPSDQAVSVRRTENAKDSSSTDTAWLTRNQAAAA